MLPAPHTKYDFRFTPESGHWAAPLRSPLCANSRLSPFHPGCDRPLMVGIEVYSGYFYVLSFTFCITSSILKLAAFWRCG